MDTLKNHDEEVIIITSFISIQPDCISAFLGIAKEIIEAYRFIHIVCRENPCRTMRANASIRHEAASGILQI